MSTGGSYRIDEKGKKTLVDRPTQDNPKGNGPIDADAPPGAGGGHGVRAGREDEGLEE